MDLFRVNPLRNLQVPHQKFAGDPRVMTLLELCTPVDLYPIFPNKIQNDLMIYDEQLF